MMATTVSPAIANSIGLASRYLPILDEIYKAGSKTAVLDTVQDRVRWDDDARTFYLFETDMVGLGDYDRKRRTLCASLPTPMARPPRIRLPRTCLRPLRPSPLSTMRRRLWTMRKSRMRAVSCL